MLVAVQPLELSLRAPHRVDHPLGKRGEEFVCQRGMPCEEPMTRIVLHFQKQRVLLNGAGALAPATVN